MKLYWKGNQKYNEDISKATIIRINSPLKMCIHKYAGCGDKLYFDCHELDINCIDLHTEDWDDAEAMAVFILKNRCDELMQKMNMLLSEMEG